MARMETSGREANKAQITVLLLVASVTNTTKIVVITIFIT